MKDFTYKTLQRARDELETWPEKTQLRFYKALDLLCKDPRAGKHHKESDIWVYKDKSARPYIDIDYKIVQELLRVEVHVAHRTYISIETHVFLSYSRLDREWFEELRQALQPLEDFEVHFWYDKDIDAGQKWLAVILEKLADADAALLLVSEPFLKSEFIRKHELPKFLERAKEDPAGESFLVLWVPLASMEVIGVDDLGRQLLPYQTLLGTTEPLNMIQNEKSMASKLTELRDKVHRAIFRHRHKDA